MLELSSRCKDISRETFGSITAMYPLRYNKSGEVVWACQCACGTELEKSGSVLRSAVKTFTDPRLPSCGCIQKQLASTQAIKTFTKHGFAVEGQTHPLYKLYHKIRSRCHNPDDTNYPVYGAKGVVMCSEWLGNPQTFIEWCLANGWKPGLQLDKDLLCEEKGIDPKIYSPETCQFVTQHENLLKSATRDTYGKNRNIKLSHADVEEMNRLYKGGMKKAHIAELFGIGKTHATRLIPTQQ